MAKNVTVLDQRMKKQHVTQRDIARQLGGLHPSVVGLWARGRRRIPEARLGALAELLHCSVEEIRSGVIVTAGQPAAQLPVKRGVRTKPCEVQPCDNLIRPAGHRCMHHHMLMLQEQWRERYRSDPTLKLRMKARLAEIHPGRWTPREDDLIRTLAGVERLDEIARRCEDDSGKKRTKVSVHRRAFSLGVSTARALWAAGDIGRAFGVDRTTVNGWMDAGQLEWKPWGNSLRVSNQQQIEAFMRAYPWLYDPDRMVGQFKQLAEVMSRRDPWWTTARVVKETGLTKHVLQLLRNDGEIVSYRRSGSHGQGNAVVYRASEVMNVGPLIEARHERWDAIRRANLIPGGPRKSPSTAAD